MSSPAPARLKGMPKIYPNLWFDTQSEEAAAFYVSVFPSSRVVGVTHYPEDAPREAGMVMTVEFELDGQRIVAINGGPEFTFSEAISLQIDCADQAEVDYYWSALSADGGSEGPCGWLKDKFGLSWQVAPSKVGDWITDADKRKSAGVFAEYNKMGKIDLAALEKAFAG